LRDHRWHRFNNSGPGAYDEEECDIWQAIAQYKAGFNPLVQEHAPEDLTEPVLREAFEMLKGGHNQNWGDNITAGFWLADQDTPVDNDELARWPDEKRAAYIFRKGMDPDLIERFKREERLARKIEGIWTQWAKMQGVNPPLERSLAGPIRDFDINLDGMAHYGMLPDLLQDIVNSGVTPQDLAPLFRSANDYVEMWDTCLQRSRQLGGKKD
jgi:hypothetical protein